MAFCTNCGAQVSSDTRFCPSCGTALAAADATSQQPKQEQAQYNAPRQDSYTQQNNQEYAYRPQPSQLSKDAEENRLLCILSYLGILLLVPLVANPNSKYCRYHCNQGLILMLFGFACAIVAIIPLLGWLVAFVGAIFSLVCLIIGIVNTCKGEMKPLPIIGKIQILR